MPDLGGPDSGATGAGAGPIDWDAAVRIGVKAAPTGPRLSGHTAKHAVDQLRSFSRSAELAVREVTLLGHELPVLDGTVVDRPGWIRATSEGMRVLAQPMTDRLAEQFATDPKRDRDAPGAAKFRVGHSSASTPASSKSTAAAAVPVGTILGFLSGKVLGQYDPFSSVPGSSDPGRLLLVAPNIVKVEREIEADPSDFRMWVCLHESTHRLQFTAVPWMRDYFRGLVAQFAAEQELDSSALLRTMTNALKSRNHTPGLSWIEATQTPAQREVFDKITAMMTLLEGHADYVMDAVGPQVVPSVAQIRKAFSQRRLKSKGPLDRLMRALLGMDLKMKQYVQGGAFVHAAVEQVGMTEFNHIWDSPDTLPTRAETTDPAAWVARVL
ncbi:zinc-dependent metalloprotease [Nakamurella antarctica]|uniref:zinc-dependent metalloprotease n=1 Tax=Nakamurella antarctica TaxID=1902245 RepID=UPI001EF08D87|nr:zinc-dependent metalloprotease [Nakamurella antarctica]